MSERRTVLLTGCSSGVGLESAVYLAEQGMDVFASMRDLSKRGALDEEAKRRGVQIEVLRLDVTDPATIEAAVAHILDRRGALHGVVNNAGIALRGFFEDLSPDEVRRIIETNVLGTMAVTRAALPALRAAGRGRLVMLSSVSGRQGSLGLSAYSASKFAIEGFSEALAMELRPFDVEVVLIAPGIVRTSIWDSKRSLAAGARNPDSPYAALSHRWERMTDRLVQSTNITAAQVAATVHEALTTRRPRRRYTVGWRAALLLALRRYIPGDLVDQIYTTLLLRQLHRGPAAEPEPVEV